MSVSIIVNALLECEFKENENLISVLSNVKSSKASPEDAHIASLVRGLCTHNSKLLSLLQTCQEELKQDESAHMDSFKLFVNSFILWAGTALAVFEKYLQCPGLKISLEIFSSPILHCGCYLAFIDSALTTIRNPFVVEKLQGFKHRFKGILETYTDLREQEKLNNISFEKVQAFGAQRNVSAHFSLNQIVGRSKDESIQLDGANVELLLLNLSKIPTADSSFNALAILELSDVDEKRYVLFPPFRVNELIMTVSDTSIVLTSPTTSDENNYLIIESSSYLIQFWSSRLERIFSTDFKAASSQEVMSYGLGIEASSDEYCECTPSLKSMELNSECSESADESRFSESSRRDSALIMKKTLSNHGIETRDLAYKEALVVEERERDSTKVEYGYTEDTESLVGYDDDDLTCFEIVNGPGVNRGASASLPDLLPPKQKVYTNVAGSAIDIHNFGKDYNPSFLSLVDGDSAVAATAPKKGRRKSLFSIFKKNKSKSEVSAVEATKPIDEEIIEEVTAPKKCSKPDLSVIVPKNSDFTPSNQPLSSTSSTFGRSLPLPFALPNSESTYFFKKSVDTNVMTHNNSTTSLLQSNNDEQLLIPEDLKQTINSEETTDVYITPSSPGSLKVSKWKTKHGKWEMLTTNENLFIKIVENSPLEECWMLVFKEEYDEEYQEVADVPLLILSIDANTNIRQSSALDLEVSAVNSITKEKMLIIARCYNTGLLGALFTNLVNAKDVGAANARNKQITSFDSNNTLASSLMSGKPSASSTLTSIYTVLNDPKSSSAMAATSPDSHKSDGEWLLLDRMTVKLHKQMDCYERIHHISSWKSIAMYTMKLYHSSETSTNDGFYHFELEPQDNNNDECPKFLWSFEMSTIFDKIETIGKAGLLVKVDDKEIFMVECKGKKQLSRLYKIF